MDYRCPECGSSFNGKVCDSCGYIEIGRIQLSGEHGSMTIGINTKMGKFGLAGLLGDDSRYYNAFQFELSISHSDGGWVLTAQNDTPNNTLINGSVCEPGVRYLLQSGDVIAIGSKKNADIVRGELTVTID